MNDITVLIIEVECRTMRQCIESVRSQMYISTPYIKERICVHEPTLKIMVEDIMSLESKYVFICNSGSILSPDLIFDMVTTIEKNDTAAVSAYALFYNGIDYIDGGYYHESCFGKLFNVETLKNSIKDCSIQLTPKHISKLFIESGNEFSEAPSATTYERYPKLWNVEVNEAKKNSKENNNKRISKEQYNNKDIILRYQSGRAGLKTIMDSLKEWGLFKIKRLRNNSLKY